MKIKSFRKVIAFVIVMVLSFGSISAFATSVPATENGTRISSNSAISVGGTVTGEAIVNNPVLEVVIPTELKFAIDPFELAAANNVENATEAGIGGQIASANYPVINKSNAPVSVSFDFTLNGASDVRVVSTSSGIDETTEKSIYLNVVAASKADIPATTGALTLSGLQFGGKTTSMAAISESAMRTFEATTTNSATTGKAIIDFLLDTGEGTPIDNSSIASATQFAITTLTSVNITAFKFYGYVNSTEQWKAGDVKINAAYTIKAVSKSNYATNIAGKVPGMLNMVESSGGIGFAKSSLSITGGTAKTVGLKLETGDQVSKLTVDSGAYAGYVEPTAGYSYSNGTFTFTNSCALTVAANSGMTFKLAVITTNGKKYKIDITIV